jgi:hypothetical protein
VACGGWAFIGARLCRGDPRDAGLQPSDADEWLGSKARGCADR